METRIGPHRVTLQGDVLTAYVSGSLLLTEITELLAICAQTQERLGSLYLITVVGPGYSLPPESRKYIGKWARSHILNGNVVAEAPFAMRVLISIISRAAKLLGSKDTEITFTETEAEARVWVAQHKKQNQKAASS